MATDKSFASQGSAAALSMLKSLPAMVDTSAPHAGVMRSPGEFGRPPPLMFTW